MAQQGDWSFPFRLLGDRLRAADLTFGNLECVVSRVGTPRTTYDFRADPRAAEGLAFAGFDVVSVANTHTTDFGPDALDETLTHLAEHHIDAVGVDPGGGQAPVLRKIGDTRIGFLAFSHYIGGEAAAADRTKIAPITGKQLIGAIVAVRPSVDFLVVSLHMGKEFAPRSGTDQQGVAHAAIDAGADLVVGHHPHVPQEVEKYGPGFIAYSLGNFVFDHPEASADGAMLEVELEHHRPVRLTYVRTHINERFQPERVSEQTWDRAALGGDDRALN
jgi:poly-gamma-glutamate capsule biosynthesis protein CapA/YwtB (metallophosphatase superfamily)